MRHRLSAHGMSIAVAVALAAPAVALLAGPARAQAAAPQAADGWTPPRTLWGDPDLQGQWTNLREAQTPFERPDALAERGITDPRNPEVLAEQQALVDDPEARQAFEAQIDAAGAEGTGAGPVHWYENLAPERSRLWFVVDPPDALGGQDAQDGVDDGRLAHARPAGDDDGLAVSASRTASAWPGASDRPVFLAAQGSALSTSMPGQESLPAGWSRSADRPLGPVQGPEEHARRVRHRVLDDRALGQLQIEGGPDRVVRHVEQAGRQRPDLRRRGRPRRPQRRWGRPRRALPVVSLAPGLQ